MEIVKLISGIPLFRGLPQEHLEALAHIVVDQKFKKGQSIFSEGDEATGFYVLISGRIKVFKLSPEGKEQIIHIFDPGEIFGEVPMFEGKNFPAHAETLEKSRIFFIPRKNFTELIKRDHSLTMNMLAALSRRLRQFAHLIETLSLKEVPGRLAAYLLFLSDRSGAKDEIELDISKGQLASLLGTIPETLSRIFSKMSSQGLIQIDGRTMKLLDKKALKELASE